MIKRREKQQAIDQVQSVNEAIEQAFEVATEEEGIDPSAVAALRKRKTRKKPAEGRLSTEPLLILGRLETAFRGGSNHEILTTDLTTGRSCLAPNRVKPFVINQLLGAR